jgi:hypothetical protein
MLNNATYDLMETAAVLSKGLSRFDQYKHDARDCQQCQQIWEQMKKTDEEQLRRIVEHLKLHFQSEGSVSKAA